MYCINKYEYRGVCVYVCMCVCVYVCVCLYLGRVMGGSGGGGGGGYQPCPSLPIVSYLLRNASVARVLRGEQTFMLPWH